AGRLPGWSRVRTWAPHLRRAGTWEGVRRAARPAGSGGPGTEHAVGERAEPAAERLERLRSEPPGAEPQPRLHRGRPAGLHLDQEHCAAAELRELAEELGREPRVLHLEAPGLPVDGDLGRRARVGTRRRERQPCGPEEPGPE